MAIKTTYTIAIIASITILITTNCTNTQTKKETLTKYPNTLLNIINNNRKIPPFNSTLGLQIDKLNLDGTINNNKKKINLILTDTLRNKKIIDALIINENAKIYIHSPDYDKIITGNINSINLEKHFQNFKINLKTLISLVSLKTFIIKNAKKIIKETNPHETLFLLAKTKNNEKEILAINNKTGYPSKISFFKKNNPIFSIQYKKYKKYKNFFFPKRIDFYHKKTNSNIIVFISNINFKY